MTPAEPSGARTGTAVTSAALTVTDGALGVVGVGTDLVDVEQLRRSLERQPGLRERLFTPAEWDYAAQHRDPLPHLAARFAAKEAVMKCLGVGMSSVGFAQIEVRRDERGAPSVVLLGDAARFARSAGVSAWRLSLTHTGSLAQAFAVALGPGTQTP